MFTYPPWAFQAINTSENGNIGNEYGYSCQSDKTYSPHKHTEVAFELFFWKNFYNLHSFELHSENQKNGRRKLNTLGSSVDMLSPWWLTKSEKIALLNARSHMFDLLY